MLDLAEIRRRWAAATPGPWEWDTQTGEWTRYRLWRVKGCADVIIPTYDGEGSQSMLVSHADAAALAAAPADIAAIFAELERLTSELAAARRGPVVEWRQIRDFWRAKIGPWALIVYRDRWSLQIARVTGGMAEVAQGECGGAEGKAACEAAYRRATLPVAAPEPATTP